MLISQLSHIPKFHPLPASYTVTKSLRNQPDEQSMYDSIKARLNNDSGMNGIKEGIVRAAADRSPQKDRNVADEDSVANETDTPFHPQSEQPFPGTHVDLNLHRLAILPYDRDIPIVV